MAILYVLQQHFLLKNNYLLRGLYLPLQNTATGGGITLEDLSLQQDRAGVRRSTYRDDYVTGAAQKADTVENAQTKVYEITAQDRYVLLDSIRN